MNRTGLVLAVVAIGLLVGLVGASIAGVGPLGGDSSDDATPSDDDSEPGSDSGATVDDEDGGDSEPRDDGDECTPTPEGNESTTNPHPEYESTTVTVRSAGGEVLGCVEAAIADTWDLRYTGLSNTTDLPEHRGMLFVYEEPQQDLTYVMREMDFPIDIVYVAANGTITSIHHARAPEPGEDGNTIQFDGYGQYVLEVNRDWTTERSVEVGDEVEFDS